MPKAKQGRISSDMQRVLASIIDDLKDPRIKQGLLTVTRVSVDPDLTMAKVYISVLGSGDNSTQEVCKALQKACGHIRSEVSKRMKIRRTPNFMFVKDDGAAYAVHINQILEEMNEGKD